MTEHDDAIDRAFRIVTIFMDAERRRANELTHAQRQASIDKSMAKWWNPVGYFAQDVAERRRTSERARAFLESDRTRTWGTR